MRAHRPVALGVAGVMGLPLLLAACTPPTSIPGAASAPSAVGETVAASNESVADGAPAVDPSTSGSAEPEPSAEPTSTEADDEAPPGSPSSASAVAGAIGRRDAQQNAGVDLTTVAALPAQAFTDSVCVNTHWGYTDTPYIQYDVVGNLLLDAGIRHIREGGTSPQSLYAIKDLAERGVRTTYVLDPNTGVRPNDGYWVNPDANGPYRLDTIITDVLGVESVDGVEIGNEWDLFYGNVKRFPDSAGSLSSRPVDNGNGYREYAEELTRDAAATLAANPLTAGIPVVGPSYTNAGDYLDGANLDPAVDYGNMHAYQGGREPETSGWGDNGYGSRDHHLNLSRQQAPDSGAVVTEGGYNTAINQDRASTPEDVVGRYLPRVFLHYFDGGFDRFCSYEFLDEWPDPSRTNSEAAFGMLRNDLSPKPSYTAVKNMMSVMADPTSTAQATPLRYSVSDPDVQQLLVSKGDGSHVLALWLGESSWDPVNGGYIDVPDRPVTINVPEATTGTVHRLDDNGGMSSTALTLTDDGQATLDVADEVAFIEID